MNPQQLQAIAALWQAAYQSAAASYADVTAKAAATGSPLDANGQLTPAFQQAELLVWRAAEIRFTAMVAALTSGAVPLPGVPGAPPAPTPTTPPVTPATGSVGPAGVVGSTVASMVGQMLGK